MLRLALAIATLCFAASAQAAQFSISGGISGNVPPTIVTGDEAVAGPMREEVSFASALPTGSVVVKTRQRRLYYIMGNGRALSFKVGVGREGFAWAGRSTITRKAEWPDWRPPPEMIAREEARGHIIPDLVKGGPSNPLGAAALYIGTSAYRIHGTDKPWSVGQAASSGCIRMMNDHVAELYRLVKVGALVVVE